MEASKGFLVQVNPSMTSKVAISSESLQTNFTWMNLLSRVSQEMFLENSTLREGLAAHSTVERFFPSVFPLMEHDTAFLGTFVFTVAALEWLLSCMLPLMQHDITL